MSHLHRDHFDPENLRKHVSKRATVLLPEFPTSELEDALREFGFTSIVSPTSGEVVDLDGLQVMIQSLTSPTDGPIGDSSLWLSDGVQTVLNQNDARPSDLDAFKELGPVDGYLVQFSGAIWFPMVYELPGAGQAGDGTDQAGTAVRPHAALHRRARRPVRVPDCRAAVLPRRGAVGFQRHLRRRVEHLPGPAGVPGLARPEGS